jgi:hypothetical protein
LTPWPRGLFSELVVLGRPGAEMNIISRSLSRLEEGSE